MLKLGSVMIGTEDTSRLGSFYEKVFDRKSDMEEEGWYGWKLENAFFSIGEHDKVKGVSKDPDRVIVNFETKDVKKEFDRIKNLGAGIVKEPYDMEGMTIATLKDPDGNLFQLMSPWEG